MLLRFFGQPLSKQLYTVIPKVLFHSPPTQHHSNCLLEIIRPSSPILYFAYLPVTWRLGVGFFRENTDLPSLKTLDLNSVTTRCVIAEGEALGPQLSGAVLIAKRFQLRKCGHHKDAVPAAECIKSMIGKC